MKLCIQVPAYYRVKRGQTVQSVAAAFGVPVGLLVKENALREELRAGQIICVPRVRGNFYVVRGGESKSLLSGSPARFEERNGTASFYPGQKIMLG